jgi:hypothetical protein
MQFETDLCQSLRDSVLHLADLVLAGAVHYHVIAVVFERQVRIFSSHPRIECIMREQVC